MAVSLFDAPYRLTPDATLNPPADQFDVQSDVAQQEDEETRKKSLKAIFGDDFPLVKDAPDDGDWTAWAENRWDIHRAGVQNNLFISERNRLFRAGTQWLSRAGSLGQWKEPPMPKDAVRVVDNIIRPSLAWALQVVAEQRPGWRFEPASMDPKKQRKAEAQQLGVEFQYHDQNMKQKLMEAGFWAQTDGVSFMLTYWNPDRGPWDELEYGKGPVPMGEPDTKVYRIEQVRVSAEATSTIEPMYWLIREVLPKAQAVALYGPAVADNLNNSEMTGNQPSAYTYTNQYATQPLYQDQDTVERYTIFCKKSEWLPGGLTVMICGKKLVYGPQPLAMGMVPIVRVSDGSEDPAFYPMPVMNELIAPQMRVNMLLSKWYESIRVNAGGRFLSKSGALVTETLVGGQLSAIEVRGAGPLPDTIMPVQGFSVGNDVKEALGREIKALEDRTGWNDTARGSFTADQSGRAILAIREALERTFAPFVGALAVSMTEWAKQQVGWMCWGYAVPRAIGVVGGARPDLARELCSQDFDGVASVYVDPETLMPMPRALRLWLLEDALSKGTIDTREYRRRYPFAFVQDFNSPDAAQEAKAKRVAEQIRTGQPQEPISWIDNEAIHQDVLEHDVLLDPSVDPQMQGVGFQRWVALATQAAQKMGQMAPAPAAPGAGGPAAKKPGQGAKQDPKQQPLFSSSPSVAAAPMLMNRGAGGGSGAASIQGSAAKQFEARSPQ